MGGRGRWRDEVDRERSEWVSESVFGHGEGGRENEVDRERSEWVSE